ncbi:MAG: cation transporting ATPase C-terminal domain-containing protein [Rhodopseudomonas palustris]|nr:cation transporting ATPase C-terminal domain-containing protein [Rhodopseudomonas palustris]
MLIALAVVIAAQLAFTYAPFMHTLFGTAPVSLQDGLVIIGAGAVMMVVLELEKLADAAQRCAAPARGVTQGAERGAFACT